MFYKITEKGIEKAPKSLLVNGKQVFTNSEKLHNENGYYMLSELPYPQDNNTYKPIYRLQDNVIVKDWEKVEAELIPYKDRIIARIREKYSIDDEIAILRQKDNKFEEWIEYNTFVENIKLEEKIKEQII